MYANSSKRRPQIKARGDYDPGQRSYFFILVRKLELVFLGYQKNEK